MNRKSKIAICSNAVILTLLDAFLAQIIKREPAFQTSETSLSYSLTCKEITSPHNRRESGPSPQISPVSAYAKEDRGIPPPEPKPAPVDKGTANVEPHNTLPTGIDFELPEPNGDSAIPTPKKYSRDKPTPSTTTSQATATITPAEPKMDDIQIADGDINKMVSTMA